MLFKWHQPDSFQDDMRLALEAILFWDYQIKTKQESLLLFSTGPLFSFSVSLGVIYFSPPAFSICDYPGSFSASP